MMNTSFKKYSLIALIILSLSLLLTIFLVNNRTNYFSKAASGDFPKNIQISNITDDSATISYQTDGKVLGNILFGTDSQNLEFISLDDRDQLNQISNSYNFHHITLRGLMPNTTYFFSINSGAKNYLNNDNFFELKTGPIITKNPPSQIPAAGSVSLQNGTSPSEGIIYLQIDGSQLTSALIKNGSYILPLNSLRSTNFTDYFLINPKNNISLEAFANEEGNAISINSNNLSPVENISLKENFTIKNSLYNPTVKKIEAGEPLTLTPTPVEKSGWSFLNIFKLNSVNEN